MSKCRLCLQEQKLCESHIIPEFFYKPMYDKDHKIIFLNNDPLENIKYRYKGVYEKLLCEDCERRIKKHEDYFINQLNNDKKNRFYEDSEKIIYHSFDYPQFRLFTLSILWRASISKHPIFKEVEIGRNEERVRNMLLNEDSGKYDDFAILMSFITQGEKKIADDLITAPELMKIKDEWAYRFVFGGFVWVFFIGIINDNQIKKLVLQRDGSIVMVKKKLDEIDFLIQYGLELHEQGKLGIDLTKLKR